MSRVLYVDACGGASGDMLAGALLGLGWPLAELERLVQAMGLDGVRLAEDRPMHKGLACRRLVVEFPPEQPHRHLKHVLEYIGRLPEDIAGAAKRVFHRLAEAEARVHGCSPEQVHFHEVGAVDAMVDVTAFCAGLAWLGWPRVVCWPLPLGRGFVDCAHGRLPLPAPAVAHLLEGRPVTAWPDEGETVTPTGAALLSALAHEFGPMPAMTLAKAGWGGGSRPSGPAGPNALRLLLGQASDIAADAGAEADAVVEIVCHLDDQSPEDLPMLIARLMAAGALDAAAAPLYMKKGRPGLALTVLARTEQAEAMAELVLAQTTTLGVRLRPCRRRTLAREVVEVTSPWGQARVKRALAGGHWRLHPEADDVARICGQTGLPPEAVRQELARLAREDLP